MKIKVSNPLSIVSPITNLFKGGKNPTTEALPYLNQVPEFGKEAYQPFIEQGRIASEGLPDYREMAQNPTNFLDMLMEQYKPSAAYERQLSNAMKAIGASGAAGGYAGTPLHQEQSAEIANAVLSGDMQQFLHNVLGIQNIGASGLENQVGRGFLSSSSLADYLGGAYGNLAQNAFEGRAGQNQARQQMLNNLLKLAATAAGGYFGGPVGAAAAGQIAGSLGGATGSSQGPQFTSNRYANPSAPYTALSSIKSGGGY